MKEKHRKILVGLFILLYIAVGFVSCYHAIEFFGMANEEWLSIILAIAFEIGQAAILFALLTDKTQYKKVMPWILMGVLTIVQIMGNVVASYSHILAHSVGDGPNKISTFVDSIMFAKVPGQYSDSDIVVLSYIIGAILPIVALCLTGMVVGISGMESDSNTKKNDPTTVENENTLRFD